MADDFQKTVIKLRIALILSVVATCVGVLSFVYFKAADTADTVNTRIAFILAIASICLSITSYILGGGFSTALGFAGKIAVFGWICLPFPIDVPFGIVTFIIAVFTFLFMPFVFVLISCCQERKYIKQAKYYVEHFKPESEDDTCDNLQNSNEYFMNEDEGQVQTESFNDCVHAQSVIKDLKKKISRIKAGLIVAAVTTALTITGVIFMCVGEDGGALRAVGGLMILLGYPCSIVSYIVGGGFLTAIKLTWKFACIGWLICPFPIDIITGIATFIISTMSYFHFPVVWVFKIYRQYRDSLDEAEYYMSRFKPAGEYDAYAE